VTHSQAAVLLCFKVTYHSCQTNILCASLHLFKKYCPHKQQPLWLRSLISFLRIHNQLQHSCNYWKSNEGITWPWHDTKHNCFRHV